MHACNFEKKWFPVCLGMGVSKTVIFGPFWAIFGVFRGPQWHPLLIFEPSFHFKNINRVILKEIFISLTKKKSKIWILKQKSPFGPVYDLFLGPSEPKMAWSVPIWPGIPTLTYPHSKLKPEYDEFDEINEKSTLNCILIFLSQLRLFLTCFWPDTAMRVKFFCWF